MLKINDSKHPVILFIPEIGIYPFARGLSFLGDAITKSGGSVFITHDTGQMFRSPIMAMYKASTNPLVGEKTKIRRVTDKNFKRILKRYQFLPIELSDLVGKDLMKEINVLTKNIVDLRTVRYRGFPVGKIAEYDFMLETKFSYYHNLSVAHRKLYEQYVKNTALAIALADKICDQYKPSLFLTFNEYAQCQAIRYSAKVHGVKYFALTYPVNLNIDASRFSIWKSLYTPWIVDHCQNWKSGRDTPIKFSDVLTSWKDSVFRMYGSGSHIFSPRKEEDPAKVISRLGLDPGRKTIVAYTSSQERTCDAVAMGIWGENYCAIDAFSDQIKWLLMLKKYVNKRKDIQIVVRIHPREGRRELGFESQYLPLLKAKLKKKTPNFVVIWPDDPISSYDLMELADVCLVSWSTVGQEAARLGIPVLSCVGHMYYPDDDFMQVATTPKEYEKKLNAILDMNYGWQQLIKAVRFYHWRTFIPSVDFGENIPADFDDDTIWPKVNQSATKIINGILSGKQDLIKFNIKKWKNSLPLNAKFQETKAMKKGIRYFLDKIFYPPLNTDMLFRIWRYIGRKIMRNNLWNPSLQSHISDYRLKYTEDINRIDYFIKKTKLDSKLRILVADGLQAILVRNGKLLKRTSPLAIRLAKLHENA